MLFFVHSKQEMERHFSEHQRRILVAEQKDHSKDQYFNGYKVHDVRPDGNCLFRAISVLLNGSEYAHREIREKCADWLLQNQSSMFDYFAGIHENDEANNESYTESDYVDYCNRLRQPGFWAGHEVILAIAAMNKINILVYSDNGTMIPVSAGIFNSNQPPTNLAIYNTRGHYMALLKE